MAEYNFTDKKITQRTTDRRPYYSPSQHGRICPFLKLDADGKPLVITDVTGGGSYKKCVCTETAPFCSYHLGNQLEEQGTGDTPFECHRYLVWHNDLEKYQSPVDTHERQLKIVGNKLGWY